MEWCYKCCIFLPSGMATKRIDG